MTSVLNVGVMQNNPVGNQIRRLETALEQERKDKIFLLTALEATNPEVVNEYVRLKEESTKAEEAKKAAAAAAAQAQNFQPTQNQRVRRF